MKNAKDGSCVSVDFFRGIGFCCPNLRILDVSGSISLSPDCLILLFFRHAYHTLHSQNVWLPEFGNNVDTIVQNNICDISSIQKHDLTKYCPFCYDEWCSNIVRSHDPDLRYAIIVIRRRQLNQQCFLLLPHLLNSFKFIFQGFWH